MDDTLAGENAGIDDISPLVDPQHAPVVLLLDRISNINELAVFEKKEVMAPGQGNQPFNGTWPKIGDDIDVSLEDSDVWSNTYVADQACQIFPKQASVALPEARRGAWPSLGARIPNL